MKKRLNRIAFALALFFYCSLLFIGNRPNERSSDRDSPPKGRIEFRDIETGDVCLTQDAIASYDSERHRIELKVSQSDFFVLRRLELVVDGETVLVGTSIGQKHWNPSADIHFFRENDKTILVRPGVTRWSEPADLRNNARLFAALEECGKLK